MAEWLCSGLQNRVHRFNSGSGLHLFHIFYRPTDQLNDNTSSQLHRHCDPLSGAVSGGLVSDPTIPDDAVSARIISTGTILDNAGSLRMKRLISLSALLLSIILVQIGVGSLQSFDTILARHSASPQ